MTSSGFLQLYSSEATFRNLVISVGIFVFACGIQIAFRHISASRRAALPSTASPPTAEKPRAPGPQCFRLAGVPEHWNRDDLLCALRAVDPTFTDQMYNLSLYPAAVGRTQTALLNIAPPTAIFRPSEKTVYLMVPNAKSNITSVVLDMDNTFLGLTPLNTPEGEITADIIAVTGLAGHAFGSWRSRVTRKMWLQDFLPQEFKNVRILSYGYNSALVGNIEDDDIEDYRSAFLQRILSSRRDVRTRNRPIIFLGHSMGGIVILQTLLLCQESRMYAPVLRSTRGLLMFATPHGGLEIKALLDMVGDMSHGESSRIRFLEQLEEGSTFLSQQRERIMSLWSSTQKVDIVSFYETVKTATVSKSRRGTWERGGEKVVMVKTDAAQLFWPSERRVAVPLDHTEIVKYHTAEDETYRTVVRHLKTCLDRIAAAAGEV